ncbi:hypothetical protein [Streptomyces sp. 8N706]|uniref:hypothetical protein n=1 Tax=Streptomyces sp. 8N706 TaxID=3457416 RepID=UPI003FD5532A
MFCANAAVQAAVTDWLMTDHLADGVAAVTDAVTDGMTDSWVRTPGGLPSCLPLSGHTTRAGPTG